MTNGLIFISHGEGKMEGILSINTNPMGNPFCEYMSEYKTYVCYSCYARRHLQYRRLAAAHYTENGKLLASRLLTDDELPRFNEKYVRFHSYGELFNVNHLANFVRIAELNEGTTFALWTKRNDLAQDYFEEKEKPKNLILVYSQICINPQKVWIPKGFDKTFSVVTNERKMNCWGKCIECLKCYHLSDQKSDNFIYEKLK